MDCGKDFTTTSLGPPTVMKRDDSSMPEMPRNMARDGTFEWWSHIMNIIAQLTDVFAGNNDILHTALVTPLMRIMASAIESKEHVHIMCNVQAIFESWVPHTAPPAGYDGSTTNVLYDGPSRMAMAHGNGGLLSRYNIDMTPFFAPAGLHLHDDADLFEDLGTTAEFDAAASPLFGAEHAAWFCLAPFIKLLQSLQGDTLCPAQSIVLSSLAVQFYPVRNTPIIYLSDTVAKEHLFTAAPFPPESDMTYTDYAAKTHVGLSSGPCTNMYISSQFAPKAGANPAFALIDGELSINGVRPDSVYKILTQPNREHVQAAMDVYLPQPVTPAYTVTVDKAWEILVNMLCLCDDSIMSMTMRVLFPAFMRYRASIDHKFRDTVRLAMGHAKLTVEAPWSVRHQVCDMAWFAGLEDCDEQIKNFYAAIGAPPIPASDEEMMCNIDMALLLCPLLRARYQHIATRSLHHDVRRGEVYLYPLLGRSMFYQLAYARPAIFSQFIRCRHAAHLGKRVGMDGMIEATMVGEFPLSTHALSSQAMDYVALLYRPHSRPERDRLAIFHDAYMAKHREHCKDIVIIPATPANKSGFEPLMIGAGAASLYGKITLHYPVRTTTGVLCKAVACSADGSCLITIFPTPSDIANPYHNPATNPPEPDIWQACIQSNVLYAGMDILMLEHICRHVPDPSPARVGNYARVVIASVTHNLYQHNTAPILAMADTHMSYRDIIMRCHAHILSHVAKLAPAARMAIKPRMASMAECVLHAFCAHGNSITTMDSVDMVDSLEASLRMSLSIRGGIIPPMAGATATLSAEVVEAGDDGVAFGHLCRTYASQHDGYRRAPPLSYDTARLIIYHTDGFVPAVPPGEEVVTHLDVVYGRS
jgi:hypothetical protein